MTLIEIAGKTMEYAKALQTSAFRNLRQDLLNINQALKQTSDPFVIIVLKTYQNRLNTLETFQHSTPLDETLFERLVEERTHFKFSKGRNNRAREYYANKRGEAYQPRQPTAPTPSARTQPTRLIISQEDINQADWELYQADVAKQRAQENADLIKQRAQAQEDLDLATQRVQANADLATQRVQANLARLHANCQAAERKAFNTPRPREANQGPPQIPPQIPTFTMSLETAMSILGITELRFPREGEDPWTIDTPQAQEAYERVSAELNNTSSIF
jgi:hypothetical protein